MARAVTVIPPTIQPITHLARNAVVRRRVAAYARVSTSSEEQLTSYEAQVDYYTRFIQSKPEWEFVRVYTDEGISAVNTKKREGFNQMVRDALDGKIDLIVTKSVSRFARNTVDSLVTVRKLKEKGVEVYFEKENIYTLDSKGELLITIMSSWHRRRAAPFRRTSPGARESVSPMERSACRIATSWAIGRATTVCRRSYRRKRKPSAGFTVSFSAARPPAPLQTFSPGKGYPLPPARKSGLQAQWRAS